MKNRGLNKREAEKRLKIFGKNEIKKEKKINPIKILFSQFTSPIILLLIFAAILSFFVNYFKHENYFDSILILIIVLFSGIAGFIQDYKAEKAVEALRKMATPKAKVIRNGKEEEIDSINIVPDDLIVLEGGDIIPADAKIIKGNLQIDESVLTGESKAVKKETEEKIFSGTSVYSGRAIALVLNTGMKTKLGKIAKKMGEIEEEETPFQKHMKKFTKKIIGFTALIIVITFAVAFKKFGIMEGMLIAVSLAVAAIPEDLPAVVTIALSFGSKMMTKKNALVRRLAVTESMGSVNIICTDKTGTITKGKAEVRDLWFLKETDYSKNLAYQCSFYCNDAKQILKKNKKTWIGDETDIALKQFSSKFIKQEGERIKEISFTSEKKMMTVVQKLNKKIVFSKGAPEVIINKSNRILVGNKIQKLTPSIKKEILEKNKEFAKKGYRVIALSYKEFKNSIESDLIFISLAILLDPPREEAKEAVKECHDAGIRVIMITGDNPLTAKTIGKEVGIETKEVVTGEELDRINDEELTKKLNSGINIFARVSPFHKLKILEILQKQGNVVAMTGDGVNDSLALKKADVGIAMGIKGTEVAKEASDITLLDDNFATIRNAIKEGRKIFDNIRKFVDYLLTCNVAEVVVVLLATLFFPFISIYPIQILWINLITDGLPALALSVDPPRPDIMKRKPRDRKEGIINKKLGLLITGIGIKKAFILLATFLIVFHYKGIEEARTVLFTGFIFYEFVRIAVIRYNEKLSSLKDWLSNKFLLYSLITSLILQFFLIYTPISSYFKVIPLGLFSWIVLLSGTTLGFILGITIAYGIDKLTKEEY